MSKEIKVDSIVSIQKIGPDKGKSGRVVEIKTSGLIKKTKTYVICIKEHTVNAANDRLVEHKAEDLHCM